MKAVSAAALVALVAGVSAQSVAPFSYGTPSPDYPGVKGTNRNGPTNPSSPQLNTPINQTSDSRLASLNSVEDWCTFGPQVPGTIIGNVEGETVAYCTKPRNNARVIVSWPRSDALFNPFSLLASRLLTPLVDRCTLSFSHSSPTEP